MNYRELLQKYKAGELPEEQRKQVRQDIEKQDAISEYLFDNEEMEFEEQVEQDGGQTTESTDGSVPKDGQNVNIVGAAVPKGGQRTNVMEGAVPKGGQRTNVIGGAVPKDGQRTNVIGGAVPKGGQREAEFTKLIRRAIRRTFIKYGVITGVIVIGIVCFLVFALPKIQDAMYYDPNKIVGTEEGNKTNQLSLDMSVYSELFLPENYRDSAAATGSGYGNYDIVINQTSSHNGIFEYVGGRITKNDMVLYNPNIVQKPFSNVFYPPSEMTTASAATPEGIAGTKKEAFDELSKLEDEKMYHAYVSLDKVYSFSEFKALAEKNDLEPTWCAISVKNKYQTESKYTTYNTGNIGFRMYTSCSSLAFDQKKYPLLTAFSLAEQESAKKNVLEEKDVTKHMTSMLQYLQDNDDIVKMIENDQGTGKTDYASMIDSIQKDGLYIYGYYVEDIGKELKKLKDIGNVSYVYTTEMK